MRNNTVQRPSSPSSTVQTRSPRNQANTQAFQRLLWLAGTQNSLCDSVRLAANVSECRPRLWREDSPSLTSPIDEELEAGRIALAGLV